MARMKGVFICQVLDSKDPIQATTERWIRVLAQKPKLEEVHVLCLRDGEYDVPDNVFVHALRANNKFSRLWRFYDVLLPILIKNRIDFFFIYQGGPYPFLLLPFKYLFRIPVYQWKAHPYISPVMKFYARFCDTKIFTSTVNAFPMNSNKICTLGQGVNVTSFHNKNRPRMLDLVTVGRVTPSKRIDLMIRALAEIKRKYFMQLELRVIGLFQEDSRYMKSLRGLIDELGLKDQVKFPGMLEHRLLPEELNRYKLFLNFSKTALDRAVVESMACGLPVLSVNPCVGDVLPEKYKDVLFVDTRDVKVLAEKIYSFMQFGEKERTKIGQDLREMVIKEHSDISLFDKFLREIQ